MFIRRLLSIGVLIVVGAILVACGTDDDDVTPTEPPAATVAPGGSGVEPAATDEAEIDEADELVATPPASPMATPGASPVASPMTEDATPELVDAPGIATPVATPLAAEATPEPADVLEDATPEADSAVAPLPVTDADDAEPEETETSMESLTGTLTLVGRAQQDYTLGEEGCVGLGEWRQLKPGAQVIVRDASGTVVDVAALEAHESDDACAWNFAIDAPGTDFFSVSIPMVTEVWFDQDDEAVESGELELFVP